MCHIPPLITPESIIGPSRKTFLISCLSEAPQLKLAGKKHPSVDCHKSTSTLIPLPERGGQGAPEQVGLVGGGGRRSSAWRTDMLQIFREIAAGKTSWQILRTDGACNQFKVSPGH